MGTTRSRATARTVRPLLLVALVAALLVGALGVVLTGVRGDSALDGPQVHAIELFAGHRSAAVVLAELGGPESIGLLVVVLAVGLLVRGRRADALVAVLAPLLAGALTQYLLKPAIDRTLNGAPAFPSGHATGTWALATVVVLLVLGSGLPRRVRLVDAALVVLVAVVNSVALVGAQFHFLTDVVGGAGVGVGVACLVAAGASGAFRRGR